MAKIVIVESPAKARTIQKYLGNTYEVIASMGHIRDLPSKDGSVNPDANFAMVWESDPRAKKQITAIAKLVKEGSSLILATDPDREGEAISWHIVEALREKKVLKDQPITRVVFHEITKRAVTEAIAKGREVDQNLVDAYLARRSLDYLVGFSLSPILWRKLPGSRSAGRVQSVALRLITERETEIEGFNAQEYWHVEGQFLVGTHKPFVAKLVSYKGEKLDKFSLIKETQTQDVVATLKDLTYAISSVETKQTQRKPAAPFTTSTLQQEAARKLGFGARKTMRIAQQLYEGINIGAESIGLITYMRTDGVTVSQEAIAGARTHIAKAYGGDYLPADARVYATKTKNAQEAHEAIRPTDITRTPDGVKTYLDDDQLKLYTIVWQRMAASQMANARYDQLSVTINDASKDHTFRATGSTCTFDGFQRVYREGRDEADEDDETENLLPPVKSNERADAKTVTGHQHFTQPPPRYSEASLVKKLEELGIGRPSTYASIISTLLERNYVRLEKKQFIPESRGRIVTAFLEHFFNKYVAYDFTANLEESLDEISRGEKAWLTVLGDFWQNFTAKIADAGELRTSEVLDRLNDDLAQFLFGAQKDRSCPSCSKTDGGTLSLKLGKFGGFIGCSRYPECKFTRQFMDQSTAEESITEGDGAESNEPKLLGTDPVSGLEITLRKGPYGAYLQWGEATKPKEKPKRATLPRGVTPTNLTLEKAIEIGQLPKTLGKEEESGDDVVLNIGRFGPYVKVGKIFASIPSSMDIFEISLAEAIDLYTKKKSAPPRAFGRKAKK
ncbi:MAG: type I DNA topoisomerase [Alphaproteobacteria bacterium]|nr:MAG: type I DNA topoisomerase [Alphaproteobacteria bacterium]